MPRFFRLLIPLSLALLSSCLNEQELPRTPPAQIEDLPETAEPGDLLEEKNMASLANANVVFVRAEKDPEPDSWTFQVTVQHPDTGWEDYADGWDVVLPDGTVIKPDPDSPFTRTLLHPHQEEQPFTRSQSGILIPVEITIVQVRAHDLVDGFGGEEILVDLTLASGLAFEVIR